MPAGSVHENLRELFLQQCLRFGPATAYAILSEDLSVVRELAFADLRSEVLALGSALSERCRPGERIVLALENGLDCVEMFWACLVAGLVPIPAPSPQQTGEVGVRRLRGIVADSGASLVVSAPEHREELAELGLAWTSRQALAEAAGGRVHDAAAEVDISSDGLAYLQYTSGSTSEPRGVELTHANVMAHCNALQRAVERSGTPVRTLSWLPWFHDFGLVQGVLSPIYLGTPTYLMPTIAFMRRPLSWLDTIARFQITDSGAPDSAFAACVRALSVRKDWSGDLSAWERATSGGEPVRADTLDSFAGAFASHGFRREAFVPAYGMAEAVLAISVKAAGEAPRVLKLDAGALERAKVRETDAGKASRAIVGCGAFLDGIEALIVDPERRIACAGDAIGEIWVRGPSIGRGYWGRAALTEETFGAHLADADESGPAYLRTGDLGFVRDGQLFITGRIKEIVLVHGRNLYPYDIELTAEGAHKSVRAGSTIAFGIERENGEAVVILAECAGRLDADTAGEIVDRIRCEVSGEFGVEVHEVVLVKRGTLPQTSSGKPRRSAARQAYLDGQYGGENKLSAREPARQRKEIDPIVAEAWATVFEMKRADCDTDFFALGGNSLIATQLVSRIKAASGVELPIRSVFEEPTVAGLSQRLRETRAQQREKPMHSHAPVRSMHGAAGPLSFSQERFWFVAQQVPESTALNIPLAMRVKGHLDLDVLATALGKVVERHDILRTTFHAGASRAESRVDALKSVAVETSKADAPDVGSADFEQALERQLARYVLAPFDLERGPLIRAHFVEIGPDDGILLIVMHHIVGDQWSYAVLMRELSHFYRAALGNAASALPAPQLQYADYATWQREAYADGLRADDEAYWMERLDGLDRVSLPADFPRVNHPVYRGAMHRVRFEPELVSKLTALGARHSASLSMVLMSALNVLLERYTGREDVAIGVAVAGRNNDWSEDLIGSFVNILVLRTQVDRSLDFAELLERVRQNALEAFTHQEMPFDQLVSKLKHPRDASRAPLFQVLFNMMNVPAGKPQFGDAQVSLFNFDRGSAQYDLAITADAEHDFTIMFEYAVQVFQPETVERLAAHYMRLLEVIADAPVCPVGQLAPVADEDAARIMELGRGPDVTWPVATVPELYASSWKEWAGKPAVVFEDEVLSYRQLDAAANALARALRTRGIGRGHKVGLHLARTARSLVAQVGVLRSGAAYVPLDPVNPSSRLEYIARDAGLSLVLVDTESDPTPIWTGTIPTLGMVELLAGVSEDDSDLGGLSGLGPEPDDPAYMIYTSGSTGQPKGVSISHRSAVNLILSMADVPGVTREDRVLSITTLNFDISVVETLVPLAVGATVVVAPREYLTDGHALLGLIEAQQVSIMQATPATWYLLLNACWNGTQSLKKSLIGGEPLPQNLAVDVAARCDEVWNMYGPTETTVWSTVWRVANPEGRGISIGRPIANTQIYVLDPERRVCPIGVEGDLFIGGDGVAIGYVNRPELTAEKFIPDPFGSAADGARIYNTGDRARWLNDGTLVHLGRSDGQVKVRGYRIEVGEIESVLVRNPDVERAIVVVKEIAADDKRLVAYVLARGDGATASSLREYLTRYLPDYMVPQHIALVDTLPLMPNGKVDLRKLADVPLETVVSAREITPPRTPAEQKVWEIWRDILGTDKFGVEDNFFELGGHSMLALRVVNRIQEDVDKGCTIPMLFDRPTISGLVAAMQVGSDSDVALAVTLQEVGETPPLFCICGIHLYQELANNLAPHRQVCALFVPIEGAIFSGEADPESLSVERIATEYAREIEKIQPKGPYYLAGLSFGGLLAFEIAQQFRSKGHEVAFLAMFDTLMPVGRLEHVARTIGHNLMRLSDGGGAWFADRAKTVVGKAMAAVQRKRGTSEASSPMALAIDDEARLLQLRDAVYQRAALNYKARPYEGPAMLLVAEESDASGSTKIWPRLIKKLDVLHVGGDHLGILKAPHVGVVAQHILSRLGSRRSAHKSAAQ